MRLTAGVVPSVHTAASSGPRSAAASGSAAAGVRQCSQICQRFSSAKTWTVYRKSCILMLTNFQIRVRYSTVKHSAGLFLADMTDTS